MRARDRRGLRKDIMPARLSNGLFISEFLADNPAVNGYDTDGDGSANKADEFVEIQGFNGSSTSLAGIEIWSAKRGQLYEFDSADSIAPGGTATVVGQYDGTPPSGFFDAGLPDSNTNGGFLEDGEASKYDTLYLVDTTTGEYVSLGYGPDWQSQSLPSGFPGTTDLGSEYIGSDMPNGVPIQRDANGDLTTGTTPDPGAPGPVCFLRGTRIMTETGETSVEDLRPGDRIETQDNGWQAVRWIGSQSVPAEALSRSSRFRAVRIRAGALGQGRPRADLLVSPQHRILVRSRIALRMFGMAEVFVPAIRLTDLPGIERVEDDRLIEYFHILLDRHEIVTANGAPAESLHLGPVALLSMSGEARAEIATLFPGRLAGCRTGALARMAPSRKAAKRLIARHCKNNQPLLQLDVGEAIGDTPRLTA